jgi:hypothetical protein
LEWRVISPIAWALHSRCCCRMDDTLARVCATRRDHRSQGSDRTGGFPTMAACRAGLGRPPKCMSTTGKRALPDRRPVAVPGRIFGTPCVPQRLQRKRVVAMARPCRAVFKSRSSRRVAKHASNRRAALVRGGRYRLWPGMDAREACLRCIIGLH